MIITVASFKGGVSKTTSAIHVAAYLQKKAPTLLIDGDANRAALQWGREGKLPFKIVDERQAAKFAREFEHIVIDTQAHPSRNDLKTLAEGCDLLIIPTTPDALSLNALLLTVEELQALGSRSFRILLTIVPPLPSRAADEARESLTKAKLPLFKHQIRRLVAFQKAALEGVTVDQVRDERAKEGWADYVSVGKEIMR